MRSTFFVSSIYVLSACSPSSNTMRGDTSQGKDGSSTNSEPYRGVPSGESTSDSVIVPPSPSTPVDGTGQVPPQGKPENSTGGAERATPPNVISGVYLVCSQVATATAEYLTAVDTCRTQDASGNYVSPEAFVSSSRFTITSSLPTDVSVLIKDNLSQNRDADVRVEFSGRDPNQINIVARSLRMQFSYTDKNGVTSHVLSTEDPQPKPMEKLTKNWFPWSNTQNGLIGVEHKTLGLRYLEVSEVGLTNAFAMQTCEAFSAPGLTWRLASLAELRFGFDAGLFLPDMIPFANFPAKTLMKGAYGTMANGGVFKSFDSSTGTSLDNSASDNLVFLCVSG